MTLLAFLLVTISAFTHAFWNFLSKRQNPPAAFFLMASLAAVVIFSPVLFFFRDGLTVIPPAVWGLIAATGAVQAIYYIFLAGAYRSGDLSHAYPLARSLPVVLVALVSVLLGRGDQIRPLAYVGFAAVTAGCFLLPLPKFSDLSTSHYRQKWVVFALLAAACITGYTLLDDQSLRILRSLPEMPLSNLAWSFLYVELETISLSLFLTLFLLFWRPEWQVLSQARLPEWRTAGVMGFIITATYGLVLLAMAYVDNVSYVSAFRQLSTPIGAALGIVVRREAATPPKLTGIGLVIFGLTWVALSN
ncbi:MAG: EamA family transporter [Chloroflexota bacterium]